MSLELFLAKESRNTQNWGLLAEALCGEKYYEDFRRNKRAEFSKIENDLISKKENGYIDRNGNPVPGTGKYTGFATEEEVLEEGSIMYKSSLFERPLSEIVSEMGYDPAKMGFSEEDLAKKISELKDNKNVQNMLSYYLGNKVNMGISDAFIESGKSGRQSIIKGLGEQLAQAKFDVSTIPELTEDEAKALEDRRKSQLRFFDDDLAAFYVANTVRNDPIKYGKNPSEAVYQNKYLESMASEGEAVSMIKEDALMSSRIDGKIYTGAYSNVKSLVNGAKIFQSSISSLKVSDVLGKMNIDKIEGYDGLNDKYLVELPEDVSKTIIGAYLSSLPVLGTGEALKKYSEEMQNSIREQMYKANEPKKE